MHNYGVTGTREGMTEYQKEKVVDLFNSHVIIFASAISLHHGDCVGVDAQVHDIASELGLKIYIYPPKIDTYRAFKNDSNTVWVDEPRDYMPRNRNIVKACDHLIVIPKSAIEDLRGGTWSTWRYAKKIGKSYTIITPNGEEPVFRRG